MSDTYGAEYRAAQIAKRTLIDQFASAALTGLLANGYRQEYVARQAYNLAYEMLEAREAK